MLTITRTNSLPTLLIGDDIKLHITIENGKAKVQIDAPREVSIRRGELRWRELKTSDSTAQIRKE